MVEELAKDYAEYMRSSDISKEVEPILGSIDQMLNRLDEFESLMITVKNDASVTTHQQLPALLERQNDFDKLCQRIDDLERFVALVGLNLNTVEQHVLTAEEELGINALGLKGLLMPILSLHKKRTPDESIVSPAALRQRDPYKPPEVFQTERYFKPSVSDEVALREVSESDL